MVGLVHAAGAAASRLAENRVSTSSATCGLAKYWATAGSASSWLAENWAAASTTAGGLIKRKFRAVRHVEPPKGLVFCSGILDTCL